MTLDNREWALAIWIAIALFGVLRSSKLRDASAAVLRALAQRSIVITFLLLFAYIALIVATLRHFGLWEVTNLKTTLIWALGSACIAIFNVQKVEDEQRFFRSALGEIIGVAVVVDFLTAIDTFPLWVEFLIAGSLFFFGWTKRSERQRTLATARAQRGQRAADHLWRPDVGQVDLSHCG